MSWNRLLLTCFGIPVKIVTATMSYKFATKGGDFLISSFLFIN